MNRDSLKIDHAAYLITVDPARRIIRDGALLIERGVILRVGKSSELASLPAERVIDASGMVATPGFVNGHMHISYAHAVRGIFPDGLENRLGYVFRMQAVMTEEEEFETSLLGTLELVKGGTTLFVDPGSTKSVEACLAAYDATGIRVVTGEQVTDRANRINLPVYSTAEAGRRMESAIDRFDGAREGRVRAWTMPFSAPTCSDQLLLAAKEIAIARDTRMTLHHFGGRRDDGRLSTQHLADLGVLGPHLLLSHAMNLEPEEIRLIERSGTTVTMLPAAAMKGAMGIKEGGRLPELLGRGVPVALGTDSVNSSNFSDMVRTMSLAALAYKDARLDAAQLPAETALELATLRGAEALGAGDQLGSLEAGKRADIVLFDARRPEWQALTDPVNNLVYSASASSVHTVIIDGRIVVEGGVVPGVDEPSLIARVQASGERIRKRAGVEFESRWPLV